MYYSFIERLKINTPNSAPYGAVVRSIIGLLKMLTWFPPVNELKVGTWRRETVKN